MSTIYHKELSDSIIGIAFRVHTKLGSSLPEHCYHRALERELITANIPYTSQQKHNVIYDDEMVGHFFTDIIVDNKLVLELKSADCITEGHLSQLFTYLRITGIKVGYLINFGCKSMKFKRLIL